MDQYRREAMLDKVERKRYAQLLNIDVETLGGRYIRALQSAERMKQLNKLPEGMNVKQFALQSLGISPDKQLTL